MVTVSFWCSEMSSQLVTTFLAATSARSLPLMFVCPLILCNIVVSPSSALYRRESTIATLKKVHSVLRTKLSSSSFRFASLVTANSLFGLTKEDWDKESDMWKLKEFEDLPLFFKVLNYSLIADFVNELRVYIA